MVDYITEYLGSIKNRKVIPEVKPGYMRKLLPDGAPSDPESWDTIFKDIEHIIMSGVFMRTQQLTPHWQFIELLTIDVNVLEYDYFSFQFFAISQVVHWQSPHMHAYYPSLTSWPSMLGDMLADAINCIGFTWVCSTTFIYIYQFDLT